MFLLDKPDDQAIDKFLDACGTDNFSYSEVGASRFGEIPKGYNADHNRIRLGAGAQDFAKAVIAIRNWKMFAMPWVQLCWTNTAINVGETVAALINHLGFWSLNASRIVYVIEEKGAVVEKFGFAYGTLTAHAEQGEERFSVELHHDTGEVWYDLFAFSKPKHVLAKLGYPLSRALQKQFASDSKKSMSRAVKK